MNANCNEGVQKEFGSQGYFQRESKFRTRKVYFEISFIHIRESAGAEAASESINFRSQRISSKWTTPCFQIQNLILSFWNQIKMYKKATMMRISNYKKNAIPPLFFTKNHALHECSISSDIVMIVCFSNSVTCSSLIPKIILWRV